MNAEAAGTATALPLDKRQRAMLKEMGVRVWSPLDVAPTAAAVPRPLVAGQIENVPEKPVGPAPVLPAPVVSAPKVLAPASPAQAQTPKVAWNMAEAGDVAFSWQFGAAHALFADMPPQPGPRWLVLAEASAESATANPLDGDAGQLLGNMLRAARLAHPGRAVLVPLHRPATTPPDLGATSALDDPLAALMATHQPDLLLVMGRLAAQALLHTTEPLGKLRGRVHMLHGVSTVVTYDAQPLLHTPADKAKAWDDLCLGMATAVAGKPGG